jgi:hypothetical protein
LHLSFPSIKNKAKMPPQSCISECEIEVFQPKILNPVVPPKRVRFALSKNEIHAVPHIDDLLDDEVRATWYEAKDYEDIKMALIPIIRKMMKGEHIEENDRQTVRGLEYRTKKGAIRRQHNKVEAIIAVMDEQGRQWETYGFASDERLRDAYLEICTRCQQEAHELALGDVEPARDHCRDAEAETLRQHQLDFFAKTGVERKPSFGKLLKQMRIRRRPTIGQMSKVDSDFLVVSAGPTIAGSTAA